MPISRRLLADDEDVLVDLHPHWVFCLGPIALTMVALAVAVVVGVGFPKAPIAVAWVLAAMVAVPTLWLVGRAIRWRSISTVVTTTRILHRQGILRRDLVQLRLQRVVEVHYTQSLFERVIGSGRLVLELEDDDPMVLDDIRRPRLLQRVVVRQLDELTVGGRMAAGRNLAPGAPSGEPVGAGGHLAGHLTAETPPRGTLLDPVPTGRGPYDDADTGGMPPALTYQGSATGRGGVGPSIPEQLIELDALRRRGILSDQEFAAKKAELLARL